MSLFDDVLVGSYGFDVNFVKETKCLLYSKVILLVKVLVLKLCCGLFRGIDTLTEVCQLKHNAIIGYRSNDNVIIVYM